MYDNILTIEVFKKKMDKTKKYFYMLSEERREERRKEAKKDYHTPEGKELNRRRVRKRKARKLKLGMRL